MNNQQPTGETTTTQTLTPATAGSAGGGTQYQVRGPGGRQDVLCRITLSDHIKRNAISPAAAAQATADHIAACLNACEGINPEAVQDLLAACKDARAFMQGEWDSSNDETTAEAVTNKLVWAIEAATEGGAA